MNCWCLNQHNSSSWLQPDTAPPLRLNPTNRLLKTRMLCLKSDAFIHANPPCASMMCPFYVYIFFTNLKMVVPSFHCVAKMARISLVDVLCVQHVGTDAALKWNSWAWASCAMTRGICVRDSFQVRIIGLLGDSNMYANINFTVGVWKPQRFGFLASEQTGNAKTGWKDAADERISAFASDMLEISAIVKMAVYPFTIYWNRVASNERGAFRKVRGCEFQRGAFTWTLFVKHEPSWRLRYSALHTWIETQHNMNYL